MQVVINDLVVNYQVFGEGDAVVIIHGWGDNLNNFNKIQANLSKTYKVISLDLPGFGASSTPDSGWSLDDFAAFIKDFINKINVDVYAYIGHSNGGAILINGLASKTLQADKLILIAASGIRSTEKLKKKAILVSAKIGKLPLRLLPTDYQLKLKDKIYQMLKSDANVSPKMIETFKKIVRQDVSEDAIKLKVPTLLIYGQEDKVTPVEYGRIYQQLIKDSKLVIIEGSGHFVHLQEADKVFALIEDYLK
ncbi:MAG TPA: alpha/beta hydrolase [Candidatus Dormibacteraeota bacterium]|nr:alpha/beta hydrolase [Candidatus Dormibacteraeota bacterium]